MSYSRAELEAKIKVSLGGRVAEEIVYGEISTGAESDLSQLTRIAREMVARWGMSDRLGPVTWSQSDAQGAQLPGASEVSPQTQWLVDEEVHGLVDRQHADVTTLLSEHREQLDNLARTLLMTETLDAHSAYAAAGIATAMPGGEVEPEPATAGVAGRSVP